MTGFGKAIWGKAMGTVLLSGALLASASAVTYNSGEYHQRGINARQRHQQERIARGIRSGQLTPHEAARLEREEYRFARQERRLRADGLTTGERARLERRESRLSRQIYRQKHDNQGR